MFQSILIRLWMDRREIRVRLLFLYSSMWATIRVSRTSLNKGLGSNRAIRGVAEDPGCFAQRTLTAVMTQHLSSLEAEGLFNL
jgi:hypothetical protein